LATVAQVMDALGELFPWELAASGDGSGLVVGSVEADVHKVMCSIGATSDRVRSAMDAGCDLLVVHHPHLTGYEPPPPDRSDARQSGALGKTLCMVCCHTNADAAVGGAGDLVARHLGVNIAGPLRPADCVYIAKLVVFVPPEAVERVSEAMADAGAGVIGDYTHCGFRASGWGTFLPGGGASPYRGKPGTLNVSEEVRLEMPVPSFRVGEVVDAMIDKHPYEEVAYDIYRTENPVPWGAGRLGELDEPRKLYEIMEDLVDWCACEEAALSGEPQRLVKRVAVIPGYASTTVAPAREAGAELLIAGEVEPFGAAQAEDSVMDMLTLGHLASERPLVPRMVEGLLEVSERRGLGLEVQGYRDDEGRWG
jgi:putative NIF3 family GTP cyclohydrolase 1 type 2